VLYNKPKMIIVRCP